jgi:hypothetical protein
LPKGAVAQLQFTLPETSDKIELEGEMAWADIKGNAGFRFRNVHEAVQVLLEKWLDTQMEKQVLRGKERSDPQSQKLQ